MFCDELKISVKAGKGGDGCVSFRREKFVPKGGPDGGDGGNGGSVTIIANQNLNTLYHLKHQKIYHAENGENGKGKKMHGKNAPDYIIEVPLGTIILDEAKKEKIIDLKTHEQSITIAKGGRGGMGNTRFKSSTHQVPRFAENGEPGEEKEITLELKIVADVGIIGLPSAGKSTLISVISNAKPKIAAYKFTTLTPNLGVVYLSSYGGDKNQTFVVADIPGLIEGASKGKGLGHQFLKHISRTKLLVHVLDGTEDDLKQNYKVIRQELKAFDKNLIKKTEILVINKIDLLTPEQLKDKQKKLKIKAIPISGVTKEGIKELIFEIHRHLQEIKKEQSKKAPEKEDLPVLKPHLRRASFEIVKIQKKKSKKAFHIAGHRIEQVAIMTDIANPEGLKRIYHFMEKLGIKKTIERKGAKIGDEIIINKKIIPYQR
ncbi:GTPase ObgE [Candidatus Peregrinibacteria bacterium]|nr:GTPase ObgE [Candidatus Peregrinibacteria bacterium]